MPKLPSQRELSWRIAGYTFMAIMGTICVSIIVNYIVDSIPKSIALKAALSLIALAAGIGTVGEIVIIVKTCSLKKEISKADQVILSAKRAEDAKLVFRALGKDANDTIKKADKQLNN